MFDSIVNDEVRYPRFLTPGSEEVIQKVCVPIYQHIYPPPSAVLCHLITSATQPDTFQQQNEQTIAFFSLLNHLALFKYV